MKKLIIVLFIFLNCSMTFANITEWSGQEQARLVKELLTQCVLLVTWENGRYNTIDHCGNHYVGVNDNLTSGFKGISNVINFTGILNEVILIPDSDDFTFVDETTNCDTKTVIYDSTPHTDDEWTQPTTKPANGTYTGCATTALEGIGTGLTVDVTFTGGVMYKVVVNNEGTNYAVNDRIRLTGLNACDGAESGSNDGEFEITSLANPRACNIDFSLGMWVQRDTDTGRGVLMSKNDQDFENLPNEGTNKQREWFLWDGINEGLEFKMPDPDNSKYPQVIGIHTVSCQADTQTDVLSIPDGTWMFVVVTHDASAETADSISGATKIYVNAIDRTNTYEDMCGESATYNNYVEAMVNTTAPVTIGARWNSDVVKMQSAIGMAFIARELLSGATIQKLLDRTRGFYP